MKIDFYVLETTNKQKSQLFTCRLLETTTPKSIFVHMNTREEAQRFDALLWTYRDDSFLPHSLYDSNNEVSEVSAAPIQIGFSDINSNSNSDTPNPSPAILFNLAQTVPSFYTQFERVIEIVFTDPSVQQLARQRYKHYRDQNDEINTIKLKENEI
jgi:DNA polymerase-3 subunit chi